MPRISVVIPTIWGLPETVTGVTHEKAPGLVITPSIKFNHCKQCAYFHGWSVTHLASKKALVDGLVNMVAAYKAMLELSTWPVDWTQEEEAIKSLPDQPKLQTDLSHLRQRYEAA